MANKMKASKKARDVVVVGMKLRPSSRELLTWTLAKFTKPGDEVVALHIVQKQRASSLSSVAFTPSDVTQGEVEGIYDSVIGVYDGFCRAKQIKLQLRVVNGGSSMRRTLVEEVEHYNAIRLILGASRTQQSKENSPLSLAKYCASHLPTTCSVLIIQNGEVFLEKPGVLISGDTIQGVQSMRDKKAGHHVSNNARGKYKIQNHHESEKNQCIRCSSRVRDVSGYMVHPFKYVPPPQVQGLHTCILELEKLSTMAAVTSASRAKCHVPSIDPKSWSHSSNDCNLGKCCLENEDHSGQEKPICSGLKQCGKKHLSMSAQSRGWPLVKTGWDFLDPFTSNISLGLEKSAQACYDRKQPSKEGSCKTPRFRRRRRYTASDIPQGWPLLHRSLAATKMDNSESKARKMSVVEWVLQLPERRKLGGLMSSSETVLQEMPICSATENVQKSKDLSDNQEAKQGVLEMAFEPEAEITLPEKCHLHCRSRKCSVFEISDLEKSTNNFSKDNMIGKGGCSRVYRGVLSDARVVAIKCFDNTSAALASENEFLTELEVASGLHHRHIIELLGYCVDNQQGPLLVYNYATEGNLEQKLHQADDMAGLPWTVRYEVALGIGDALEYLHNLPHPVIHRDVKSSNILLQSDLTPQLSDFGLSKWASTTSSFLTCNDVVGTFGYLAPEYFMFGKVNDKTDVYSFGVVLVELVSGKHPIEKVGCNGQQVNLILWARPLLEEESSHVQLVDRRLGKGYNVEQLKNMLMAASLCLQHSPHARPSMSKILKVLKGENVDLELRQDSMSIDGCVVPSYGDDYDIHDHLTLALYGLDDDLTSQVGNDQKACHDNTNKLLECRNNRSNSFD